MASIPKLLREMLSTRFGWVGFLARSLIHGNLALFEIPNKSFFLYAFISKNRNKQDSKEVEDRKFAMLQLVYELQSI